MRSPLDAVHAAIVVCVFMNLQRICALTRLTNKKCRQHSILQSWNIKSTINDLLLPFCTLAFASCQVLLSQLVLQFVHSTRQVGHLCPLALILLPYQNSSVIGAGGQNVSKPVKDKILSTEFAIFGFHLGWAQATCHTGPSCPTRLAARLWVPSFTSKILTDRSLEERNMWMSRSKLTS